MTDTNFNIIRVNDAYTDMVGKKTDECIGTKCYDNRGGEKCHTAECPLRIILSGKQKAVRCECFTKENSHKTHYMITAQPFYGNRGKLAGIVESFQDITEQKTIEGHLREQECFYRTVFDTIQDGITVLDLDLNIIQANQTVELYYGNTDITGKKCYQVYHNKKGPCENCPAKEAIRTGKLQKVEITVPDNQGDNLIIELFAVPFHDASGNVCGIVEYGRNITDRRKAEEAKVNLISELHHALSEIKVLKGILPFCSYCKKIRDDNGYWEKVDVYIHEHSAADISHGICPDCLKKFYPEHYEQIKNGKEDSELS